MLSSRFGSLSRLLHIQVLNYLAALHHELHALESSDVSQRIAINSHNVGPLSRLNSPDLVGPAQQIGIVYSRSLDRLQRSQSQLHHNREFARVEPMRIHGGIGPEADFHSRGKRPRDILTR